MRKLYSKKINKKVVSQYRRKLSIRKKISGTSAKPRICIVASNKHFNAQVIDDNAGVTLFSVKTFGKNKVRSSSNKDSAQLIGVEIASQLKSRDIVTAVFDRNGKLFGGKLSVLADAIRSQGIKI